MAVTATGTPCGSINLSSTGAPDKTKAVSGTVNDVPTITLGSISSVSSTATSFSIPYTATTNNPTRYSISVGTPTAMPSFVVVNNRSLQASPISVTIPASAANTYHFNLTDGSFGGK
jgi:large repetitive protein